VLIQLTSAQTAYRVVPRLDRAPGRGKESALRALGIASTVAVPSSRDREKRACLVGYTG